MMMGFWWNLSFNKYIANKLDLRSISSIVHRHGDTATLTSCISVKNVNYSALEIEEGTIGRLVDKLLNVNICV